MNYDSRISVRVTENERRILRAIEREHGVKSTSEAFRLAVGVAGEALGLTPGKAERRPEVAAQ